MLTATNNAKIVTISDLMDSPLGRCLIPDNYGFRLLENADGDPRDMDQLVGGWELFRLPPQGMVMVGEHGTIISATPTAMAKPHPTYVMQRANADGYYVISDYYGCETNRVARLVATVWVPGRDDAAGISEVDHVDGNRTHDDADNLEWVTHAENIRRSHQRPGRRPRRQWTDDDVVLLVPRRPGGPEVNYGQPLLVHAADVAAITRSTNVSHCLTYGDRPSCGLYYAWLVPYAWLHANDVDTPRNNRAKLQVWDAVDMMEERNGIRWTKDMAMGLLCPCRPLRLADMHQEDGYYYYAHYIVGGDGGAA